MTLTPTSRPERGAATESLAPSPAEAATTLSQPTILGKVAVAAMLAGLAQNVVATYVSSGIVFSVDDVLVIIMGLLAATRAAGMPGALAIGLFGWLTSLSLAALTATQVGLVDSGDTLLLFRQVIMPAVLVFSGLVLSPADWRLVTRWAIAVAVVNALYVMIEILGFRPIDPSVIAQAKDLYIYSEGVAGNYLTFNSDGSTSVRAGGLFLNPPIAGIALALGSVLTLHTTKGRWRIPLTLFLAAATVATVSRGGFLVLAAGVLVPALVRRLGRIASAAIISPIVFVIGYDLAATKGSGIHLEGLIGGLADAWAHPFGRGFGYAGNLIAGLATTESAESLAGIAFSAGGLVTVALYAAMLLSLSTRLRAQNHRDQTAVAALALGALSAALFAETAGSLNATVPLWLAVGYAFICPGDPEPPDPVGFAKASTTASS